MTPLVSAVPQAAGSSMYGRLGDFDGLFDGLDFFPPVLRICVRGEDCLCRVGPDA